jgi:hypothetical protein
VDALVYYKYTPVGPSPHLRRAPLGSLCMATTPSCDLSGWLKKRGGLRKNWLRRWFELRGAELYYYESQTAARQGAKPNGSIPLRDCCDVRRSAVSGASKLEMELECAQRTFRIQAADDTALAEWLRVLQAVQKAVAGGVLPGRRSFQGKWVAEGTTAVAPAAYNPGALGAAAVASAPPPDQGKWAAEGTTAVAPAAYNPGALGAAAVASAPPPDRVWEGASKCSEGVPPAAVNPEWVVHPPPGGYVVHAVAVDSAGHEFAADGGSGAGVAPHATESGVVASITALNRVRVRWSLGSGATPSDSDYIGICKASSALDDYSTYEYNGGGQRSGEVDVVYDGTAGTAYVARYYGADGAVHAQSAAFVFPCSSAESASAAVLLDSGGGAPALEVLSAGRDGQLRVRFGLHTASAQSDYIAVHTTEGVGAYDYVPEGQTCGVLDLDLSGMDLMHGYQLDSRTGQIAAKFRD